MSILPATQDDKEQDIKFTFVRGTRWDDDVQVLKNDGSPVDLSPNLEIKMRLRKQINDTDNVMELSLTNGKLVMVDASEGKFGIRCSSSDTLELPLNDNKAIEYVTDVIIQRSSDEYEPALAGKVIVQPQVTRPTEAT